MQIKKVVATSLAVATIGTVGTIIANAEFVQANDDVLQYVVDGEAQTGWFNVAGKYYYADNTGKIAKSTWKQSKDGKQRFYFGKDGAAVTGFVRINGNVYYFNKQGLMRTGWIQTNKGKRYFASDGIMRTGWLRMKNGNVYYCDNNTGYAVKGWQEINDAFYYFDNDCKMVTGTYEINNVTYTFASDGKCTSNIKEVQENNKQSINNKANSETVKETVTTKVTYKYEDATAFLQNLNEVKATGIKISDTQGIYAKHQEKVNAANTYMINMQDTIGIVPDFTVRIDQTNKQVPKIAVDGKLLGGLVTMRTLTNGTDSYSYDFINSVWVHKTLTELEKAEAVNNYIETTGASSLNTESGLYQSEVYIAGKKYYAVFDVADAGVLYNEDGSMYAVFTNDINTFMYVEETYNPVFSDNLFDVPAGATIMEDTAITD